MIRKRLVAFVLVLSIVPLAFLARAQNAEDIRARIRKEGTEHSQILKTMHMLTDLYGPRLTGSPNHKGAAEWAIKQMQQWGLENGRLEPWDFKHPGWLNERLSAHIISPVKDSLVCEVLAWTPSTRGVARGKAYQLVLPERVTQEQLDTFFGKERRNVRGRIVLVGKHQIVPVNLNPPAKRTDDKTIEQRFDHDARPSASPSPSPSPSPDPKILSSRQIEAQFNNFLK